jgi:uncharacterized 2Fe-2S/4Fe-4S cluster protein (DUF4445 family)
MGGFSVPNLSSSGSTSRKRTAIRLSFKTFRALISRKRKNLVPRAKIRYENGGMQIMGTPNAHIRVDGRILSVKHGISLMEALVSAGFLLRSDCGGRGRCGKCLVRATAIAPEALGAAGEAEVKVLGEDQIGQGYRLACCTRVIGDAAVEIPGESLLTPEVVQKGLPMLLSKLENLPPASSRQGSPRYGLAVDLGTTTIAVYLCDLHDRAIIGSTSARNPQAIFGDDVISRISAVRNDPETLPRLQTMAVSAIDWAASALCNRWGIDPKSVGEMVAVGNSTMVHLLLGEDPSSIGVFPYAPKFSEERIVTAESVGLRCNPAARLRTLPLISGYLGADIISAAIAADLSDTPTGTMLVDVGTNGEIICLTGNGLAATSCATGPAFEGASIRHGMQATSGAVDSVRFNRDTGRLDYTVIQRDPSRPKPAAGICGSGVITAVAELLRAGILFKSGSFNAGCASPCLRPGENGVLEFEIVPPGSHRNSRAITLTQTDVRSVQLAKGALRTGIDLLCRENGMSRPRKILLAGAFGSFINRLDALTLGMFPEMEADAIEVVGNAAGAGAVLTLLQEDYFTQARETAHATRVLDLAAHPDFQSAFVAALSF